MSWITIGTMIFALGGVYGGLIASLIYFFKKKPEESKIEDIIK